MSRYFEGDDLCIPVSAPVLGAQHAMVLGNTAGSLSGAWHSHWGWGESGWGESEATRSTTQQPARHGRIGRVVNKSLRRQDWRRSAASAKRSAASAKQPDDKGKSSGAEGFSSAWTEGPIAVYVDLSTLSNRTVYTHCLQDRTVYPHCLSERHS